MDIYEIIKPGTWLDNNDRKWCREIEGILSSMEEQFYEANLALNLCLHAAREHRAGDSREQWEADSRHRYEIRKEVESAFKKLNEHSSYDDVDLITEIRFKREQWQAGRMPKEFQYKQRFLHARSFLCALDSFERFLGVLKAQENIPSPIPGLHQRLKTAFPDLKGDKNTPPRREEADVSTDSMVALQAIFQEVLDAFAWTGPKVHLPSV